jgi:hypothetical protein
LWGGRSGMFDGVAGDHIQISPPYIFTDAYAEQRVTALEAAIQQMMRDVSSAREYAPSWSRHLCPRPVEIRLKRPYFPTGT